MPARLPVKGAVDRRSLPSQDADSWRTIAVILLARIGLNLQFRVVYPFLPAISRGLGVSLEMGSLLLTVRALVGATSPVYGVLADRYGRRALMMAGLVALVAGSALAAGAPSFGLAATAFAVLGLGKASYDPAMQAYIGDAVPYARRGRVLGIVELAWALSWLVGVPAAGLAIAAFGWRSLFWLMAGWGAIGLLSTWLLCPHCGRSGQPSHRDEQPSNLQLPTSNFQPPTSMLSPALMMLSVTLLLMLANENVFIVYGAWLEDRFGLSVGALGLASVVISLAELLAEGGSAALVDRLGKRRAVLGGLALNMLAYLLLPRVAGTLAGALAGVSWMILTFEFSIVSMIPMVSELVPEARATVMSLNVAAMAAGRVIGSLSGPRLWTAGGLALNGIVSAGVVLLAGLILWRGVKET